MLQERPLWQANYKSMSPPQLVAELGRISRSPRSFETLPRKTFIVNELALRAPRVIIAETDTANRENTMALSIVDGPTIAAGESLSDGADCTGGNIVRLTVPQEFADANLTFQSSSNGDLYNDLYDTNGREITISAKADTSIIVEAPWARSLGWIKIRSGTRANPVPQTVDCKLAIAVEVAAAPPV